MYHAADVFPGLVILMANQGAFLKMRAQRMLGGIAQFPIHTAALFIQPGIYLYRLIPNPGGGAAVRGSARMATGSVSRRRSILLRTVSSSERNSRQAFAVPRARLRQVVGSPWPGRP